jgi:hypothetical protein
MRFLVVASLILAGCHPMPPCYVFIQAGVTDHPMYTRMLLVKDEMSAAGPVFYSAEDALVFAKDANLLLCATKPVETYSAMQMEPVRDAGQPDAGQPDAGKLVFTSVKILADGGTQYTKEMR